MAVAQSKQIVEAVHLGVITEEEAIEFLVALKHGDIEAIERLWREHKRNIGDTNVNNNAKD